jgi:hypothetical protein
MNGFLNGQQVLANFDIAADAGAANRAIDKSFQITVTGGLIDLQLVGIADNPKINAIEIVSGAMQVSISPTAVNLGPGQTQQFNATVAGNSNTAVTWSMSPSLGALNATGGYTAPGTITATQQVVITATSVADVTKKATAIVTLMPPAQAFVPIRVNAGGAAYTDPSGQSWNADQGFLGGASYQTSAAISNTATPALYQSERWATGTLEYKFNVPNGTYTVNLKFAEIYLGPGQRLMNVFLNGQQVLANFDIASDAGGSYRAIDKPFQINVTSGLIDLQLVGIVDNPKINAIEIM